ncbi:hypothetical protein [Desulfosporosinus meridiei]|uniref:Uncharacterized protein n=1 Tax=Desulfosporosinus meridiei (strain ATCC BAA-275 / DSM 13257 / KCTC 12902 / NCIMB 13706 / S10) TaxID=768704 RepID=J7IW43_DESMD|nr:hypothetical protein [Desulfosporosinus meridiei]AFQ45965.1 hypothetical protein Desmer_4136 [Desulfosporosinus meridiei DSM 13257]
MAEGSKEINLEIVTKDSEKIIKPEGLLLIDNEAKWVCLSEGYYNTSIYVCDENTGEILGRADANQDWSRAEITFLKHNQTAKVGVFNFFSEIILRNRIIFYQGIVIHAAAISWEGLGIIFTAPSETGKSTQAELWTKYKGARILNDDRPALRLDNDKTYVHGTPWSGKKELFLNESAPLTAIILLEQASQNSISRMPVTKVVPYIMPRCFLPYYNQAIMEKCLNNLGQMLAKTPVYLLKCRPDFQAVELVHECLTHNAFQDTSIEIPPLTRVR